MKKLLLIIALLTLIHSCTTTKYIEIPVKETKTEYIYNTRVDSIYTRDSIDRWLKGDSVFIYKERIKYKYLNKTDTIVKIDSIPKVINVETVKEVEVNHIKWYQKALMWIGGIMSLILTGYIIYKVKLK